MAEVFRYKAGLPSFSEVLEIISRWSEREKLSDQEKETAKVELETCVEALKGKTDGMSGMVRGKVAELLEGMG